MGSKTAMLATANEFDLDIRLGEGHARSAEKAPPSDLAGFTGKYCTCVSVTCWC